MLACLATPRCLADLFASPYPYVVPCSRSPTSPPTSQSISSLIDREYLRRKDGELNVFEYLA